MSSQLNELQNATVGMTVGVIEVRMTSSRARIAAASLDASWKIRWMEDRGLFSSVDGAASR
jgi:hypothetical protein